MEMTLVFNAPNGKHCQVCNHTPAQDYNDAVQGRFCFAHYIQALLKRFAVPATAIAIVAIVIATIAQ